MVQVKDNIFLVGSGVLGLSHEKDCHVYLIKSGREAALIDAGSGLGTGILINNIKNTGCKLEDIKYLFLTHAHGDHTGGVYDLKQQIDFSIVASEQEKYLLEQGTEWELGLTLAKNRGSYPQDYIYKHTKVDIVADSNRAFTVGKLKITPIIVPGHSSGSTCYLLEDEDKSLFTGDTVFLGGFLSLLNCPGSEMKDYRDNLHKLSGLNITGLFPGHHLWTIKNGQKHIDLAVERLKSSGLPPMFN